VPVDSSIAFQLDVLRLDAETRARVQPVLDKLQRELAAAVVNRGRVDSLLAEARDLIAQRYGEAAAAMSATTNGLPTVAAAAAVVTLAAGVPPSITPTAPDLSAFADDILIQGATQRAWWARQADDTAWRFAAAVRQGLAANETNQQIIYRIAGRAGFPGVMDISRRNAAALVQTGVATVANEARMATFRENQDLIAAYRWLTALDGHVCPACAARADLRWRPGGQPIGHAIVWRVPPIHFNDRCVIVPDTKTWRELGSDMPEPPQGMRASRNGPVSASTTFAQWLDRQPSSVANDVLGPGRADLWREGRLSLQDLVNGQGRPLTLEALWAKYG
jgi:hypothetical protein